MTLKVKVRVITDKYTWTETIHNQPLMTDRNETISVLKAMYPSTKNLRVEVIAVRAEV